MWTVSTTKGVSLFSSVWELGTPLFYQCPILGVQFNPPSPPAPLPWGEGSMLHKKQKALTQTHKKASLSQRPKPHHLMKCERAARHRRVALSHFGGRGGTSSPHTKKTYPMVCAMRWLISVRTSCALPCAWAVSLMRWAWTWTVRARTSSGRTMERWWKRALARAALR